MLTPLVCNAELLYKEGLDNKLIMQIPKTKYSLICVKISENNWKTYICNTMESTRVLCHKTIDDSHLSEVLTKLFTRQIAYKSNKHSFKQIKALITNL